MEAKDKLLSFEILRDFVSKVLPIEMYMKNLIIDQIETPNKRLQALRASLKIDEATFAKELDMDFEEYHQLEKCGNPVQIDIPVKISEVFEVPLDWLFCKVPMVPIPREKEKS